jgi:ATP-dependent Clp protease ATP-binding subunit ClpC
LPDIFGPASDDQSSNDNSFEQILARLLAGQGGNGQFGRPIDIGRLLSRRTHELLGKARDFAVSHGHAELDALHILRAAIDEHPASDLVTFAGADRDRLIHAIEGRLPGTSGGAPERPPLTSAAQRVLLESAQAARAFGSTYVDPEHVIFALVVAQDSVPGQLLSAAGVTPEAMQRFAQNGGVQAAAAADQAEPQEQSETPTLDKFGTDLTARAREGLIDPVIGRADEIEATVEILLRRTKNNPVLIGEPGVGKTAIVEGLAQRIASGDVPQPLKDKRVVSLDMASMVAGTRFRGDFEERLTQAVDEIAAHSDKLIVFIDELHTVVGAGSGSEGGMDAGNILKPRLARGELHIVGATTLTEYRRVEKDAALERRFQPVQVPEPSVEDAVQILAGLASRYEEHHAVTYTPEAIRASVELSHRYVSDRFLPDKAIDLIDQAGARRRLRLGSTVDVAALQQELADLESAKNQAVAAERYEEASALRDRMQEVETRLEAATAHPAAVASSIDATIDEEDIAEMVSRATGIPASRLTEGDRSRLAVLEHELHARVIGQDDAVEAIAKSIRRSRTGMGDSKRPTGSFLFLGPTGVGKTELAKALASSLFGDESSMLRFDMSEFGERHTVSRLVGAPPGYVGYDEAGQLTERVRRNPYSVILLDEIEKAHPDVFNLLLQVLDDGRLTDGQGRTVDFRNTVIIMTSNLGSEFLASRSGAMGFTPASFDGSAGNGFGSDKALRDRVMGKLREAMRPEFLNRIDEIVLFQKLSEAEIREIVSLMLLDTEHRLLVQDIRFSADDESLRWLAEHGYEPEYGARPLRRLIQREVDDRIAELLVAGSLVAGDEVRLSVDAGSLSATAHRTAPASI